MKITYAKFSLYFLIFSMPDLICSYVLIVSCTIWDLSAYKKVDLTVLDISSSIIRKVDMTPESTDYFKAGMAFCIILCLIPCLHRLNDTTKFSKVTLNFTLLTVPSTDAVTDVIIRISDVALGVTIP